jgi:hypothetical protein
MGIGTGLATCALRLKIGRPVTTKNTREIEDNDPFLERETGIEPASLAWKARVLPLNYSRAVGPFSIPSQSPSPPSQ